MNDVVVRAVDVTKVFRAASRADLYPTLRAALAASASRAVGAVSAALPWTRNGAAAEQRPVVALDAVSFEVRRGEIVGFIGRNGSGKSTLLKVLARITHPTGGRAVIRGQVAALLEAGTGFHPELTGRENVFLNGAILGMTRAAIRAKFDEIVAFSELERFIDTPVKHYSSGMYMRLGFAVAAHVDPDILLVDEVLAVGDAAFQQKCLARMGQRAEAGRTVLFVSHNMTAVQSLCERVVWLRDGRIAADGAAGQVIAEYLHTSSALACEHVWSDRGTAPGNDEIRLHRAVVRPVHGSPTDRLTTATPLAVEVEYWNERPAAPLALSLQLYNEQGVLIFDARPPADPQWRDERAPAALLREVCIVPGHLLNDGRHRIDLSMRRNRQLVYRRPELLAFDVHDARDARMRWYGAWPGAVRPKLEWRTELAERPVRQPADS